jgi:hypothetical protein
MAGQLDELPLTSTPRLSIMPCGAIDEDRKVNAGTRIALRHGTRPVTRVSLAPKSLNRLEFPMIGTMRSLEVSARPRYFVIDITADEECPSLHPITRRRRSSN